MYKLIMWHEIMSQELFKNKTHAANHVELNKTFVAYHQSELLYLFQNLEGIVL